MKLTKKSKMLIENIIKEFFEKEITELIESDYPPDMWSKEDKKKFDAFYSSYPYLYEKIIKELEAANVKK